MRSPALAAAALALLTACSSEDGPGDPLDPELLEDIAGEQGSASGSEYSGDWRFDFTRSDCDCPNLENGAETIDLCELGELTGPVDLPLAQGGGYLIVDLEGAAMLSGPIDDDDSFTVAGSHDLGNLLGELAIHTRLDGAFSSSTRAEGSAGQRLIGTALGDDIDCRQRADFEAQRL